MEIPATPVEEGGRSPQSSNQSLELLPDLKEQKEIASRMAVAERIARVIAHDLNNIFQSLLVNLQFAESGARENPAVLSDIRDAQQTTDRALALAKRLQLFTRSLNITTSSVNLSAWLESHRQHLADRAQQKIAIGIRDTDVPCIARAETNTMLEIMEQLVDNAAEAMPEGGTLLLSPQPVDVPAEYRRQHPQSPPPRMVMLEVRDTGPGMAPDVRRHAFEPYYSANKDARESGHGLAFVYAAIRKMNGIVDIQSATGEGTTVRLYLPAADESDEPEASPRPTMKVTDQHGEVLPPTRGILIIESDPIVREVASRCLSREGYPVHEAQDGDEAIEIYRRHADEIALVVLEFALPRRSGIEVQTAIRAISPQQRFLFSSSFNSDLRVDAIAEDPRIQLIPKPFTRADLLNTVELMIGRP